MNGKQRLTLCVVAGCAGAGALTWGALGASGAQAWGTLIATWLFFAGIAMGMAALSAAMDITSATWARGLEPHIRSAADFIPVAAGLSIVLAMSQGAWATWAHHTPHSGGWWLNVPGFAARHIVLDLGLFGAAIFLWRRQAAGAANGTRPVGLAVGFCLLYALILSLWAVDFVLGLGAWMSTLIGAHLFMGALLSGVAMVSLLGSLSGRATQDQRHDLGKLQFGLSIFWAYLLWSQYLPIWFGNMPEETAFVLARTGPPWRAVTLTVLACTFILPFIGLFSEKAKRCRRILPAIAGIQLFGLWLERQLLVVPSLGGAPEASLLIQMALIAAALAVIFFAVVGRPIRLHGQLVGADAAGSADPARARSALDADAA